MVREDKQDKMRLDSIRQHWQEWAKAGVDVRATTKTQTIKSLEIEALARAIANFDGERLRVLEAGCGNGQNCVALAQMFPDFEFDGFDYIDMMVESARLLAAQNGVADRTRFSVGDLLDLLKADLREVYDVVLTVRAIINLNTSELQFKAIKSLCSLVRPGGMFLLLENFAETYESQNDCRELLDLPRRTPAVFNTFLNSGDVDTFVRSIGFELLMVDDFASLHDLMLYVLVPSINGGHVEYDHPLVKAASTLSKKLSDKNSNFFGQFGQNRLFVFRKNSK